MMHDTCTTPGASTVSRPRGYVIHIIGSVLLLLPSRAAEAGVTGTDTAVGAGQSVGH